MSKKQILYPALFILLFTVLLGCGGNNKEEKTTLEGKTKPLVKTEKVSIKDIERVLEFSGTILPFDEYQLCAAAPGKVQQILVDIGDKVVYGQKLVLLDQTQYYQAKIQFELLKVDMERMDTLLKAGSIAEQKYDQLKAQYEISKNNLEFLEMNTALTSPINGEITGKYLNDGEIYTMAPNRETGKPGILTIMNIDKVKIPIAVSEIYYPLLKTGTKANVKLDSYPTMTFEGYVYKIYPTIDKMSRTFTVEMVVSNYEKILKPGMFARVSLDFGIVKALVVPSIAVIKQTGTNQSYVFVYENEKAFRRIIIPGKIYDDNIEIISGISEGENIIVAGQTKLLDQSEVTLVK